MPFGPSEQKWPILGPYAVSWSEQKNQLVGKATSRSGQFGGAEGASRNSYLVWCNTLARGLPALHSYYDIDHDHLRAETRGLQGSWIVAFIQPIFCNIC